eukprot:1759149-Heterocapsa_arctica.AAC.1
MIEGGEDQGRPQEEESAQQQEEEDDFKEMIAGWLMFFHELGNFPYLFIPELISNVINHKVSSATGGEGSGGAQSHELGAKGMQEGTGSSRGRSARPSTKKTSWAKARLALASCEKEAREKAHSFRKEEEDIPDDWDDDESWECYVQA